MTLGQIRSLVLAWTDDPNGTYFTQPVLDLRINLALKEMQKRLLSANKEYYLSCVKTDTVANQQVYALPSDFMRIIRLEWYLSGQVSSTQGNQIMPITPNQRDLVNSVQAQTPQYYSMAKNTIWLWPVPTTVIEVHLEYSYLVSSMVNAGDEPDAPEQFHEYIAVIAARDCLIQDGRPLGPMQQKLVDYETLLKQIADQRQVDTTRMVVTTGFNQADGGNWW